MRWRLLAAFLIACATLLLTAAPLGARGDAMRGRVVDFLLGEAEPLDDDEV
jgi:hypothetical protein